MPEKKKSFSKKDLEKLKTAHQNLQKFITPILKYKKRILAAKVFLKKNKTVASIKI